MKNIQLFLSLSLIFFCTILFSQISVGGGLTFTNSDDFDRAGISVRGQYPLNNNWRITGEFNNLKTKLS